MNKHIKIFLGTSLVLNIFFAGMFFGHTLHHFFRQNTSYHTHTELVSQLPEDKRKLLKDTMHSVWLDTKGIREQVADARKEASQLLLADPINEAAYLVQVQRMSDLHTQIKRRMAQSIVILARQFTPDERAILADIISHPPVKEDKD